MEERTQAPPSICLVCRRRLGPALRLLGGSLCEECLELALDASAGDDAYTLLVDQLRQAWGNGLVRQRRSDEGD